MNEDQYYEMLWDCPSCKTQGLLGKSQRHCPACGQAQNPGKRYFPEPGHEVEAQGHTFVGADWSCAYCDSPNAAAASFCSNCGASKDGTKTVTAIADPLDVTQQLPPEEVKPSRRWWYAIIFAAFVLIAGIVGLFASKKEIVTHVTQTQWQRSIEVERFTAVSDSAWCEAMPSSAYAVSHGQEIRSHRQVADGQVCKEKRVDKADGTFVKRKECSTKYREEPVYDDKCHYMIDRWHVARTLKTGGDASQLPAWPTTETIRRASQSLTGRLGDERLGQRHEDYAVTLSDGSKTWHCNVQEELWTRLKPSTAVAVKVRSIGGAACDSIEIR